MTKLIGVTGAQAHEFAKQLRESLIKQMKEEGPVTSAVLFFTLKFRDKDENLERNISLDPEYATTPENLDWEPMLNFVDCRHGIDHDGIVHLQCATSRDDLIREYDVLSALLSKTEERMTEIFWQLIDDQEVDDDGEKP